jgi:hypothetical protein
MSFDLELPASITRLVGLGDPHGDLTGLERVLAHESGSHVAHVSVGDNVGYADGATSSIFCARLETLKIPSVLGNHEEWMSPEGDLFIGRRGGNNKLTRPALAYCHALPFRLRVRALARPELRVVVVHSLKEDRWEYVDALNARDLLDAESADVVLSGHSHGPKLIDVGYGERVTIQRLELEDGAILVIPIDTGHRYIVDCGSLARPGHHPDPGRFELATYGVVDVAAGTLGLRAIAKDVPGEARP